MSHVVLPEAVIPDMDNNGVLFHIAQNLMKIALTADEETALPAVQAAVLAVDCYLRTKTAETNELKDDLVEVDPFNPIDVDLVKDKLSVIAAELGMLP